MKNWQICLMTEVIPPPHEKKFFRPGWYEQIRKKRTSESEICAEIESVVEGKAAMGAQASQMEGCDTMMCVRKQRSRVESNTTALWALKNDKKMRKTEHKANLSSLASRSGEPASARSSIEILPVSPTTFNHTSPAGVRRGSSTSFCSSIKTARQSRVPFDALVSEATIMQMLETVETRQEYLKNQYAKISTHPEKTGEAEMLNLVSWHTFRLK